MRIAIVADIHGNLTALDAVLADMEGAHLEGVVCLGDVAATGPQPREVVERLGALAWPVVMGNADAAMLRPMRLSPRDADGRRVAEIDAWCAAQLHGEHLAYLRTFPPTITVPLGEGGELLCYHGSPRSNTEGIVATTPDAALGRMLAGHSAAVLAGGHTHVPFVRRYRQTMLCNPGSVGLPYVETAAGPRNPPWAEYAIVERRDGAVTIELRTVPVDTSQVVKSALRSGMPHAAWWAGDWA